MKNIENLQEITKIEAALAADLHFEDRILWKESKIEFQSIHKEIGIWILLYFDSDTFLIHQSMKKILNSYISKLVGVNVTLSYSVADAKFEQLIALFDNVNEIFDKDLDRYFDYNRYDKIPIDESWVFSSKNSSRQ